MGDLGLARLLEHVDDDALLARFVEYELGAVLAADARRGSDLLGTLRVFLEANGRRAEAARALHVGRSAMYTRVVAATGGRLVFVSGQVADDAQGELVAPGDLAAQARQAFANVGHALAAAGAASEQVARITTYVVALRLEQLPDISAARIAWPDGPPSGARADNRGA